MAELRKNPEGIFFSKVFVLEKVVEASTFPFFSAKWLSWPKVCFSIKQEPQVAVGEIMGTHRLSADAPPHKQTISNMLHTARPKV